MDAKTKYIGVMIVCEIQLCEKSMKISGACITRKQRWDICCFKCSLFETDGMCALGFDCSVWLVVSLHTYGRIIRLLIERKREKKNQGGGNRP